MKRRLAILITAVFVLILGTAVYFFIKSGTKEELQLVPIQKAENKVENATVGVGWSTKIILVPQLMRRLAKPK